MKKATAEGIRDFPLTKEALEIAEALHKANPDQKYLFMSNDGLLKDCTFNRHLVERHADSKIFSPFPSD